MVKTNSDIKSLIIITALDCHSLLDLCFESLKLHYQQQTDSNVQVPVFEFHDCDY